MKLAPRTFFALSALTFVAAAVLASGACCQMPTMA